nr:HD domain-containing phosphohydrolase [Motiliproteus sediminis]
MFVDDERNILSALRRLFRPLGYNILLAESGAQGLALLEQHPVDLVISDMRMPEMDGAQFLSAVAERYPDTVRILLTGFSDLSSTIDAINRGKIYRYLSKPWEDTEITLAVRQALETKRLEREKRELMALTERQNLELKDLNDNLEQKVEQRTAELQQTADMLDLAFEEVKETYHNTMRVFAGLIGMRETLSGRHSERIAELAKQLAQQLQMTDAEADDVYYAGLLHLLGKLGLPDKLVEQPLYALGSADRKSYMQHPLNAQTALMPVEALQGVGGLLRAQEERWDGSGYPDGLKAAEIPLGARALAVARDYYGYQTGRILPDRLSPRAAQERLQLEAGKSYDPEVVAAFTGLANKDQPLPEEAKNREQQIGSDELAPGMRLSRDLYNSTHTLLLTKGREFNDVLIRKLINLERSERARFEIHVVVEGGA